MIVGFAQFSEEYCFKKDDILTIIYTGKRGTLHVSWINNKQTRNAESEGKTAWEMRKPKVVLQCPEKPALKS